MIIPIFFNDSKNKNYDIVIDVLPELTFDTKVAIITNSTVSKLHLATVLNKIKGKKVEVITISDGEEYKNLETIEKILDELFSKKMDRKSYLIALGGGVIGDITGFCASIYQRGISFIQIPTTLLSQVDASVGGKTGVNNRFGKNLIGSFYQPKGVYIDIDFLETLPKREFYSGVAEIIKMAVMFDKGFFEYIERENLSYKEVLKRVIARSVELKAEIVNQDEKESGIRAVLNYGHTFAHVIENETEYKRYLHGEAVAMGMVMANRLSYELGLIDRVEMERIKSLLEKNHLPTEYKVKDVGSFYNKFFLDKKSMNDKIKFILPKGIGGFVMKDNIDRSLIERVLL